jgi:hypothetical protein
VAPDVDPTVEVLHTALEQAPELRAAAASHLGAVNAFFDWRRIATEHISRISEPLPSADPDLSLRV